MHWLKSEWTSSCVLKEQFGMWSMRRMRTWTFLKTSDNFWVQTGEWTIKAFQETDGQKLKRLKQSIFSLKCVKKYQKGRGHFSFVDFVMIYLNKTTTNYNQRDFLTLIWSFFTFRSLTIFICNKLACNDTYFTFDWFFRRFYEEKFVILPVWLSIHQENVKESYLTP